MARDLVGKVLRRRYADNWLSVSIVETEAYYLWDKGSHASLGRTPSREALFMAPATIYMYFARGGDSLNFSTQGAGNAVLIKSGAPFIDDDESVLEQMHDLNPAPSGRRPDNRLCSGQTLLCRALNLKVQAWDRKWLCRDTFFIEDVGYRP
ncbi:MAG: DNA-3-methyladenine glycosylase, partial [Myxococcota bacterium]